jgi:hypothetical protein
MAKRKKTHHKKTTHRRRVGAIHAGGIMGDLMSTAGFIVGHIGGGMIQRNASFNPKLISGAELVGGFMLKRHAKGPFFEGLSWGIIGAGSVGLAHSMHVISGVEDYMNGISNELSGAEEMQGIANEHMLNGMANEYSLNGVLGYAGM